jgi:hypothetical protein
LPSLKKIGREERQNRRICELCQNIINMGRTAKTSQYTAEENAFWEKFVECDGVTFTTLKGLEFSFEVRGNEVFFDRKEKSVTRATVMQAYRKAKELLASGIPVDDPKKLGVFGASYIYPVFRHLGILESDKLDVL